MRHPHFIRHSAVILLCLSFASSVWALTVDDPLPKPGLEARAQNLFHEIRCVVCQGEAIADSPAEVARDMRRDIRDHIAAGDSDDAIKANLVVRYGDYILMKPPLKSATALLWFGPLLIVGCALLLVRHYFKTAKR